MREIGAKLTLNGQDFDRSARQSAHMTRDLQEQFAALSVRAEQTGQRLTELRQRNDDLLEGVKRATAGLRELRDGFKAAAEEARKLSEIGTRVSEVGVRFAAIGAAITGPLLLAARGYVEAAGTAESTSRRWLAATEDLTQAQQDVGRVVAQAALPHLARAADLAERAARWAERNPGAVETALTAGAVITGVGAFLAVAGQGIKLVADVKYITASTLQQAAAVLMQRAAQQQLAAAGMMAGQSGAAAASGAGGAVATAAGGAGLSVLGVAGSMLGGAVAGFGGHEALARTQLGQSLGMIEGTAGRALSLMAYSAGSFVNREEQWFSAMARLTGVADQAADSLQQVARVGGGEAMSNRAQSAWGARYTGLAASEPMQEWRAGAVAAAGEALLAVEQQVEEQRRALLLDYKQQSVDLERRRGQERQIEALRAGWALEDAERRANQRRAQIQQQYEEARARAAEQHQRAQVQAQREYERRLVEIQRRYEQDEFEATLNRDAAALFRARRTRDQQTQEAGEQYSEQLQAADEAYQQSLEMAARARETALQQLEQSLREEFEARRRAEERQRIEQRLQLQFQEQERQIFLNRRILQAQAAYSAELELARRYYNTLLQQERQYQALVSRQSGGGAKNGTKGAKTFALGGYTGSGGLALVHPGEFVLNAATTRRLEQARGEPLTQQNVGGGLQVNATFTGMGGNDRAWFEAKIGEFAGQLAGMLEG